MVSLSHSQGHLQWSTSHYIYNQRRNEAPPFMGHNSGMPTQCPWRHKNKQWYNHGNHRSKFKWTSLPFTWYAITQSLIQLSAQPSKHFELSPRFSQHLARVTFCWLVCVSVLCYFSFYLLNFLNTQISISLRIKKPHTYNSILHIPFIIKLMPWQPNTFSVTLRASKRRIPPAAVSTFLKNLWITPSNLKSLLSRQGSNIHQHVPHYTFPERKWPEPPGYMLFHVENSFIAKKQCALYTRNTFSLRFIPSVPTKTCSIYIQVLLFAETKGSVNCHTKKHCFLPTPKVHYWSWRLLCYLALHNK